MRLESIVMENRPCKWCGTLKSEENGTAVHVKEAVRFAEELCVELNLEHPRTVKKKLRKCQVDRLEKEVTNQRCQGSLLTTKLQDEMLKASGCF